MRAILEFNLPEESEGHRLALRGAEYKAALDEIWERVFRPNFKHGYSDEELNELAKTQSGYRIIELLSEIYRDVCQEIEE